MATRIVEQINKIVFVRRHYKFCDKLRKHSFKTVILHQHYNFRYIRKNQLLGIILSRYQFGYLLFQDNKSA